MRNLCTLPPSRTKIYGKNNGGCWQTLAKFVNVFMHVSNTTYCIYVLEVVVCGVVWLRCLRQRERDWQVPVELETCSPPRVAGRYCVRACVYKDNLVTHSDKLELTAPLQSARSERV